MSISASTARVPYSNGADRHGRGFRSPLLPPGLPGYRSRRQLFDHHVVELSFLLRSFIPEVADIELAVEDVPPSDPTPWENAQPVLGRLFPADRGRCLPARLVFYRLPIQLRCSNRQSLRAGLATVFVENLSNYLQLDGQEVMQRLYRCGYLS